MTTKSALLDALNPILIEWKELVLKYTSKVTDPVEGSDAPYWYTERANVGLLAAAAWRKDCIALEEFSEMKTWKG